MEHCQINQSGGAFVLHCIIGNIRKGFEAYCRNKESLQNKKIKEGRYDMRKVFMLIAAFSLLFSFGPATGWGSKGVSAAEVKPQIKDIIDKDTMLMDDGVLWSRVVGFSNIGLIRTPANLISATDNNEASGGLGISQDGKLMEWDIATAPAAVEGQS